MIRQIAKKEIQHNLYSIRFPALLLISAVLFILNAVLAVTEPVQDISNPAPDVRYTWAMRQHNTLQFCVREDSIDRTQWVLIWASGRIRLSMQNSSWGLPMGDRLGRFSLPHADRIDWMFIIKTVFSLFAIIFTFDAVCWERESGTLTLICSNSVSRSSVLLGKYLGTCGTLFIPFVVGIILNLLIIASGIAGEVSLKTEYWLRMGLLILASIAYISLFALLGLLVSSAVRTSSTSLMILLTLWVVFVIVHPNLAGVIAENRSKMESRYQLRQRLNALWWMEGRQELIEQSEKDKVKTQEEFDKIVEKVLSKRAKTINDIESRHRNALAEKRRLARRIAIVSPAAIYHYIGEAIADSGFERQQRFLKAAQSFYPVYEDYIRRKVGKVNPMGGRTNITIWRNIDGKRVEFRATRPEPYEGDMSDFPYFTESRWTIVDSLRISLNNLAVLLLWNVVLFVTAHYVFVRRSLK